MGQVMERKSCMGGNNEEEDGVDSNEREEGPGQVTMTRMMGWGKL